MFCPALLYAHPLGEPGFEYKETIKTGTLAAVRRIQRSVQCRIQILSTNSSVTTIIQAIQEGACCLSDWCDNKKRKGGRAAEMGIMPSEAVWHFPMTDPVMNSLIMKRLGIFKNI